MPMNHKDKNTILKWKEWLGGFGDENAHGPQRHKHHTKVEGMVKGIKSKNSHRPRRHKHHTVVERTNGKRDQMVRVPAKTKTPYCRISEYRLN